MYEAEQGPLSHTGRVKLNQFRWSCNSNWFLNSFSSLLGSNIKSNDGVDLSSVFFENTGMEEMVGNRSNF